MFVGRVIPNKKFEDVIRAFHVYRTRHNPRSRLLLVGSYSGFEKYLAMLHALVARLGTPDVHFLGHVSNEELTALYDVADLFLCASEHEGFCVPLIESVLQARAGAGLRRDGGAGDDGRRRRAVRHEGSVRGRAPDGGGRSTTRDLEDARARVAGRRARAPAAPGTSAARCCGSSTRCAPRAAAAGARGRRGTSGSSSTRPSGSRSCGSSGRRSTGRCRALPSPSDPATSSRLDPDEINQWVPAAHRGDAIGDSARRVRDMLRAAGPRVGPLRADDRRRPARRRAAVRGPGGARGDVTIFHFALPSPMTEAFARARRRAGAAVPQHHAGGVLRAVRSGAVPARGARPAGAGDARRPRRPGARRLRVQPPGARGARLRADRRDADCRQHRRGSPARRRARRSRRSSATA